MYVRGCVHERESDKVDRVCVREKERKREGVCVSLRKCGCVTVSWSTVECPEC